MSGCLDVAMSQSFAAFDLSPGRNPRPVIAPRTILPVGGERSVYGRSAPPFSGSARRRLLPTGQNIAAL